MGRGYVDLGVLVAEFFENEGRIPSLIDTIEFRSVAQEFGIPPEQSNHVRLEICSTALGYMLARDQLKKPASDRPSYQRIIKRLRVVASSVHRARIKLDQLSDEERALIRSFEKSTVDPEVVSNWKHERSSFGHRIYAYPSQDGGETKTYLHLSDTIQAIAAFDNMLSHLLVVAKPVDKGGRRRDEAMQHWVTSMQSVWTDTLGRKFTFDAYRGGPISEAARFCWRLLQLVDPDARWPAFVTTMRDAVKASK